MEQSNKNFKCTLEFFDFGDALYFLRIHNENLSRIKWVRDKRYLSMCFDKTQIEEHLIKDNNKKQEYIPSQEDVLATDWFVLGKDCKFDNVLEEFF